MRATTETIHIPAHVAMIPIARQEVTALLADTARAEDAVLVTHELVLDAVRHSHGTLLIKVTRGEKMRIEVYDQRRRHPRHRLLCTDEDAPDPIALESLAADELGSSGTRGTYVSTWAVLYETTPTDTGEEPPTSAEDSTLTASDAEELLRPNQVARMLKVTPRTVVRWAESGRLPCVHTPGTHRRYRRRDVEALANQRAEEAEEKVSLRPTRRDIHR